MLDIKGLMQSKTISDRYPWQCADFLGFTTIFSCLFGFVLTNPMRINEMQKNMWSYGVSSIANEMLCLLLPNIKINQSYWNPIKHHVFSHFYLPSLSFNLYSSFIYQFFFLSNHTYLTMPKFTSNDHSYVESLKNNGFYV